MNIKFSINNLFTQLPNDDTHGAVEMYSMDARHSYNAIIRRHSNKVVLCTL